MRNIMFKLFFTLLLTLCGISAASAQLAVGPKLRAQIPYDFMVNDKGFAAGQYTIERSTNIREPGLLVLRSGDGQATVLDTFRDESPNGYARTELAFDRVDGRYFLSRIALEGQYTGYAIPKSKRQRQLIARAREVRQVVISSDTAF